MGDGIKREKSSNDDNRVSESNNWMKFIFRCRVAKKKKISELCLRQRISIYLYTGEILQKHCFTIIDPTTQTCPPPISHLGWNFCSRRKHSELECGVSYVRAKWTKNAQQREHIYLKNIIFL